MSTRFQKFGLLRCALRYRSFCKVIISISTCPASKVKVVLRFSAVPVMSTDIKGFEMNDTHGFICSKSQNLFSNSFISLLITWQYFSTALSKATDAETLSLRNLCTEGKCTTLFLCKCAEKMFILALKAFTALIIFVTVLPVPCSSQFKLFSFSVTSVKKQGQATTQCCPRGRCPLLCSA